MFDAALDSHHKHVRANPAKMMIPHASPVIAQLGNCWNLAIKTTVQSVK
jgi:hypothetical protein